MKKFLIAIISLTAVASALAQTKTVTNADLEKFRLQRIEADRKLKEKFAEQGTTIEEVEEEARQRRLEMEEYSDQLRRERVELQNAILTNGLYNQVAALNAQIDDLRSQGLYYPNVIYGVGYPSLNYYGNDSLKRLRRLPPNARTAAEYSIGYPNTPGFNRQFTRRPRTGRFNGGIKVGGGFRFGGGRGFLRIGRRR